MTKVLITPGKPYRLISIATDWRGWLIWDPSLTGVISSCPLIARIFDRTFYWHPEEEVIQRSVLDQRFKDIYYERSHAVAKLFSASGLLRLSGDRAKKMQSARIASDVDVAGLV